MNYHPTPVDDDRTAALEVLLLLADAHAGWREYAHAVDLLDDAELAIGALPFEYALKRRTWTAHAGSKA
jgi:hypothetical protein